MLSVSENGRDITEVVCRVVADLFELCERGEYCAFPLQTFRLVDLLKHVIDDGMVKAGLFWRQGCVDDHLILVGKIADNSRVAF